MYIEELRRAVLATPRGRLAEISSALWRSYAGGAISDEEAQSLAELIKARQQVNNVMPSSRHRVGSRPRTPASIERRRRLTAAGYLPPSISSSFTTSEAAALSVVAGEVSRAGVCELTVGGIAARAGTCATIVRSALREARRLGLVHVEVRRVSFDRNRPNLTTIVSAEWLTWLRIGAKRDRGPGCRFASPTGISSDSIRQKTMHDDLTEWEFGDRNRKVRASSGTPRPWRMAPPASRRPI